MQVMSNHTLVLGDAFHAGMLEAGVPADEAELARLAHVNGSSTVRRMCSYTTDVLTSATSGRSVNRSITKA